MVWSWGNVLLLKWGWRCTLVSGRDKYVSMVGRITGSVGYRRIQEHTNIIMGVYKGNSDIAKRSKTG